MAGGMPRLASTLLAAAVLLALAGLAGSVLWQRLAPTDAEARREALRRDAEDAAALASLSAELGRPLEGAVIAPAAGAAEARWIRALAPHDRWPVLVGVAATLEPVCGGGAGALGLDDPACWAVGRLTVDGAPVE